MTDEDGLEIIVAPGVTQQQVAAFLDLLSDAFVHVGGKGGLVIETVEEKAAMTNGEFLGKVAEWIEEQTEDFTGARAVQMEAWTERLRGIAEQMLKDEKYPAVRP